jgi:DNA-binding NtrC family response regulator
MSFKELGTLLEGDGAARKPGQNERPQILIVDDDITIRESLFAVMRDQYNPIVCASAKEGVAAIHEDVCAVILDVKMGKYDGFWACDEIRKRYPDVPVIFYSAYQDAKDPYNIINEHRPFGYITKDGNIKRLLTAVETAVRLYTIMITNRKLIESYRNSRDRL